MQELKMQNGLLLQLVRGLQSQINSKNRQNQILFQQYETLAADNSLLRQQLDALKLKHRDSHSAPPPPESPREMQYQELLNQCDAHLHTIRQLEVQLDEKGGALLFMQNQLVEARHLLEEQQRKQEEVSVLNSQKIAELEAALTHKDSTVSELTEYMETQAAKIAALTKQGMAAIVNYEAKLEQKDKIIEQLSQDNQKQRQETNLVDNDRPAAVALKQGEDSQRLKDLQALLTLKEQSLAELSEFMHLQSQKIANYENKLSDSKVGELEEQIVNLNQIILSKEQSLTELGQFLHILTNKCQELGAKLQRYQAVSKEAEARVTAAEESSKYMQMQIAELRTKQQVQAETLNDYVSDAVFSSPQINEIQVKLSTKEDQLQHAKTLIIQKEQNIEQCLGKISHLQDKIRQLQEKTREGANASVLLTSGQENIENNSIQLAKIVEELQEEIVKKQSTVMELSEYLNDQHKTIEEIRQKLRICENEHGSKLQHSKSQTDIEQQGQIGVFSQKIQQLQSILVSKVESLAELTAYLQENQVKMGKYQEDNERLVAENNELRSLTQNIEDQTRQMKHKSEQGSHQALVKQLQTRLQEMEAINVEKEQLQLRLSERQQMLDQLRNKIYQKQEESVRMSLEISARSQEKIVCGPNCERLAQLAQSQQHVQNLESIISAKNQTIADLSEFMNDQAMRIQQFENAAQNTKGKEVVSQKRDISNKIDDEELVNKFNKLQIEFQTKIREKDCTIAQFSEFIEDKTAKIKNLQQQIAKLLQQQSQLRQYLTELKQQKKGSNDNGEKAQQQQESLKKQLQMCREIIGKYQNSGLGQGPSNQSKELAYLKEKIDQLQGVVQSKTDMIMQLSEFMNSQATRLQQLQGKSLTTQPEAPNKDETQRQKIEELLAIITSKELSITELTEYLQQSLQKMSQLQTQLASQQNPVQKTEQYQPISQEKIQQENRKQSDLQLLKHEQEFESAMADFNKLETQKKQLLMELQVAIQEKRLQLQNIKTEVVQKHTNRQNLNSTINKLESQITKLTSDRQKMTKAKAEMLEEIKGIRAEKKHVEQLVQELMHQVQEIQTKLEHTEVAAQSETEPQPQCDWKTLIKQKQNEINSLTQVLQILQEELRGKDDMIRQLQVTGTQLKPSQQIVDANQQNEQESKDEQNATIIALRAQNDQLKQELQQLLNKLNAVEKATLSSKQQDLQLFENQLSKQTQKLADDYRRELAEMKQLKVNSIPREDIQEQVEENTNEPAQTNALTASQILAQLLVYSDEKSNFKHIRGLLISLNEAYRNEFQAYEQDNKDLRQAVDSLLQLREVIDQQQKETVSMQQEIDQLNKQIKQKNELIEELQQMNQQKQKSFNDKLEGIRQSVNVFGDQNPFTLSKLLDHPQDINIQNFISNEPREKDHDKREIASLKEEIDDLRNELQHAKRECYDKGRQIQQFKKTREVKQPTFEKEFDELLQDSRSNINADHAEEQEQIQHLQTQREELAARCLQYETKIQFLEQHCSSLTQTIQKLNNKIGNHKCEKHLVTESEGVHRKDSSRVEQNGEKGLVQLLEGRHGQDPPSSSCSGQRDTLLGEELNEKNEIIGQLQETILKLEKGYNGEIMELRRNNAQLNAQIINLRRRVYLYDPGAVDVAELIKDTCSPVLQDAQYFRPTYNMKYHRHYGQQRHNLSSLTEQYPRREYQPYYAPTQPTLGEKMMGRRCRGGYPVNLTINNEFRLNASAWAQHQ